MVVQLPTDWLVAVLLAAVRITAWILLAPPFSSRAVPAQVKALLAVAIALPLAPRLREDLPPLEPAPLIGALVVQVALGAALGFVCYLVFVAVQMAGDLLDVAGGFSLASAYDPLMMVNNAVLSRFYALIASTLLLVSDAWLLVWRALLATFRVVPLDAGLSTAPAATAAADALGALMLAALQIAAPLLAVLFLADVGLGLATRVAPQLNAYAMGFPVKILMTLSLMGFGVAALPEVVRMLADHAVTGVGDVVTGSAGGTNGGGG